MRRLHQTVFFQEPALLRRERQVSILRSFEEEEAKVVKTAITHLSAAAYSDQEERVWLKELIPKCGHQEVHKGGDREPRLKGDGEAQRTSRGEGEE